MADIAAPGLLIWAALPSSRIAIDASTQLKLSVMLSPRLVSASTSATVDGGEFPHFDDWPALAATLRFNVEIGGSPAQVFPAVLDESLMDSNAWKALFSGLPVQSHVPGAPALGSRTFVSYQVGVNYRNIVSGYHPDPGTPPSAPVSADASRQASRLKLAQLVGVTSTQRRPLRTRLHRLRKRHGAVTAARIARTRGVSTDALHFEQLSEFFDGLVAGARARHEDAQSAPPPVPPEYDFHRAITAVARYPALMRKLGLVLDLTVTADRAAIAALPAAGLVRVTLVGPVDGWQSFTPWTRYSLDRAGGFFAAPASDALGVLAGMLQPLDTDTEMGLDLDGVAPKLQHALSLSAPGAVVQTPKLPAPRSGGLALARDGLADTLRQMLDRQAALEDGLPAAVAGQGGQNDFQLAVEDLLRGFRVDIRRDGDARWLSLNQRRGSYNLRNGTLVFDDQDEGFINLQTFNPDSDNATALYAHETLFRWTGWSLSAPRPGNTIGSDGGVIDPAGQATSNVPLQVKFAPVPGSLPRLRFGAGYDCRLRTVDLAGNGLPLSAATPDELVFRLGNYLRFDPVIAPTLAMRDAARAAESVDHIVIRSDIDAPAAETSERLVAPPKTSAQMAEWHGMFDTPTGVDAAAYSMLRDLDGSFPEAPYGSVPPALPYLPDPIARGASLRVPTPLNSPQQDPVKIPFDGTWPRLEPFRLLLREGSDPPAWDAVQRLFTVSLAKGRTATYELASYIDAGTLAPDPADDDVKDLALFDYWNSIEARPTWHPYRTTFWAEVVAGRNEQLTPHRIVTLVHAVPRPLVAPLIDPARSGVARTRGDTSASIGVMCPLDVASTGQVELLADWDEPVDDGVNPPSRRTVRAHVGRRSLDAALADGDVGISAQQEFHDSKHRRINYSVVATTRYGEYFPEIQDPAQLTQVSAPLTLDVPCSAPPAPPKVLYIVPAFAWQDGGSSAAPSRRRHVGLRVYLDRPWYSSGDGERLGVRMAMLPVPVPSSGGDGGGGEQPPPGPRPFAAPDIVPQPPQDIPEAVAPFVTQWGMDPAFPPDVAPDPTGTAKRDTIPSPLTPLPQHFKNAKGMEFEVVTSTGPFPSSSYDFVYSTFDVAFEQPDPSAPDRAADPTRDPHNGRWYCDLEIDAGTAYFPFLRLALVRVQADGQANDPSGLVTYDNRFSAVALADFVQLAPGRSASIVPDGADDHLLHVTITGPSFVANEALGDLSRPPPALAVGVEVNLGEQTAPLWIPMASAELTGSRDTSQGVGATVWRGDIRLPLARGSRAMRLSVREYEVLPADVPGGDIAATTLARRLVYADVIGI